MTSICILQVDHGCYPGCDFFLSESKLEAELQGVMELVHSSLPGVEIDDSGDPAKDIQRDKANILIARRRECGLKT